MKKVDELAELAKAYHKAICDLHGAECGDICICTGSTRYERATALQVLPKSLEILAEEAGVAVVEAYGERYFLYDDVRFFTLKIDGEKNE